MKISPTKIKDLLMFEPEVFADSRGWFTETYNKKDLESLGINTEFVQDNRSFSAAKGILRGLHFQNNPHTQAKLVSCTKGAVLDVAVDLRKDSPTYKQWLAVELTAENKKQLFIPRGFAHGFLTMTDNVEFTYKVDNYYNKQAERTIIFNDPELGIDWGGIDPILSEKDKVGPLLKDCDIDL
jgi:dTDP-4-dehydrorhamnose 3,5-epimerase